MAQVINLITSATAQIFHNRIVPVVNEIAIREGATAEQLPEVNIVEQNIAADTLEKKAGAKYPSLHVYCERLENRLKEKFRTFSGVAHVIAEIRVSHDHAVPLENQMRFYTEAVTKILDEHRGDWGNGVFYCGEYDVIFSTIKHGGKNYFQSIKVSFILNASVD